MSRLTLGLQRMFELVQKILVFIDFVQLRVYGKMSSEVVLLLVTHIPLFIRLGCCFTGNRSNKGMAKLWGFPLMEPIGSQLYNGIQHM
jgi:hypothetical protein